MSYRTRDPWNWRDTGLFVGAAVFCLGVISGASWVWMQFMRWAAW